MKRKSKRKAKVSKSPLADIAKWMQMQNELVPMPIVNEIRPPELQINYEFSDKIDLSWCLHQNENML